jgi:hypothetical protein
VVVAVVAVVGVGRSPAVRRRAASREGVRGEARSALRVPGEAHQADCRREESRSLNCHDEIDGA